MMLAGLLKSAKSALFKISKMRVHRMRSEHTCQHLASSIEQITGCRWTIDFQAICISTKYLILSTIDILMSHVANIQNIVAK